MGAEIMTAENVGVQVSCEIHVFICFLQHTLKIIKRC